jgi:AAA+ superfamily predicted ATPase
MSLPTRTWREANRAYLSAELARLRVLLHRRVLWLRSIWKNDPLQNYHGLVVSESEANCLLVKEDSEAEARFYGEDPSAAALAPELERLQEDAEAQAEGLRRAGAPVPLDVLAQALGLTPFERRVLLLCLAPEVEGGFERLYAYVQDDVTRKYATPQLALSLFGDEDRGSGGRTHARDSFLPEAPLRRMRLVVLEPAPLLGTPMCSRPLRMDDRVVGYLLGTQELDPRVSPLLRPVPPAALSPTQQRIAAQLLDAFSSEEHRGAWSAVNLIGPPGAGKRSLARVLCEGMGLHLLAINRNRLPLPCQERDDLVRLLHREALLVGSGLYIDAAGVELDDSAGVANVNDLIDGLGGVVVLGSQHPWQSSRSMAAVRVPKPEPGEQRELWRQALGNATSAWNGEVDVIVHQFDMGPGSIAHCAAAARSAARLRQRVDPTAEEVWDACREHSARPLDELASRVVPCHSWEDLVLPEDTRSQLREIADQATHRLQVYENWGFGAKLRRGRGITALFAGPSGTGKTLAAEILANHLRLDLYRIDLAGVMSKYIGETEKNLRRVFDAAESSGAILFFDEADALFGKRSEVRDSHDRYANIEIDFLLQRMEEYQGVAILATNMKALLDQGFLRRLRYVVDFPFPDSSLRLRIWRAMFPPRAAVAALDYASLSRLEIAGGNIRNIVVNAAFLAAAEGLPIGMEHLLRAARREYGKLAKLISESEFGPYSSRVSHDRNRG